MALVLSLVAVSMCLLLKGGPTPVAATAAKELLIDVSEGKLTVASVVVKENSAYVGHEDPQETPNTSSAMLCAFWDDKRRRTCSDCYMDEVGLRSEGLEADNDHLHGEIIPVRSTLCLMVLPADVHSRVSIQYRNYSTLILEAHHFRRLQSTNDKYSRRTLQYVGETARQPNLIFLAGGYQDEKMFNEDVAKAIQIMKYPLMPGIALARYFSLVNIFSVYEASEETGASKTLPTPVVRKNNLGCSFGRDASRLVCDLTKSLTMAAQAPPVPRLTTNVVVVIVNEERYGGAAVYSDTIKATYFYNGALRADDKQRMGSLMYHELGHAMGNLMDEYSYEIPETRQLPLANCYWSQTNVPWKGWVDKGRADREPTAVCAYTNYFKPTTTCIMSKLLNPQPCAVCTEATVRSMYWNGMSHFAPLCPHRFEIIYVSNEVTSGSDNNATFYINHKLVQTSFVTATWSLNGTNLYSGSSLYGESHYTFDARGQSAGTYLLSVTVTDSTDYVLEGNRKGIRDANFVQNHSWVVKIVDKSQWTALFTSADPKVYRNKCDDAMSSGLHFQPGLSTSYVASCPRGKNCTAEKFIAHPFDGTGKIDSPHDIFADYIMSTLQAPKISSIPHFTSMEGNSIYLYLDSRTWRM